MGVCLIMDFHEYQKKTQDTAVYPKFIATPINMEGMVIFNASWFYPLIGLNGEVGEVSEKLKKVIRDKKGFISDETKHVLMVELGDVLWYISQLCTELNILLDDVAKFNLDKLQSRKMLGTLHGSGDDR